MKTNWRKAFIGHFVENAILSAEFLDRTAHKYLLTPELKSVRKVLLFAIASALWISLLPLYLGVKIGQNWKSFRKANSRQNEKVEPPALAECLVKLLNKDEDLIGHFAEEFDRNLKRFGVVRARRLYWMQTLRSVGPLSLAKLSKWGIVAAIVDFGRRKLGL